MDQQEYVNKLIKTRGTGLPAEDKALVDKLLDVENDHITIRQRLKDLEQEKRELVDRFQRVNGRASMLADLLWERELERSKPIDGGEPRPPNKDP